MITYSSENVKFPNIKRRETTAWIRRVAATYGKKVGEVGYLFCDDEHILSVNREYLGHDYYTDIITFDYDEGNVLNGDLVISLDTVRSNAELFGKDYDEELHRVIIHGILHLCGINDKGPGERLLKVVEHVDGSIPETFHIEQDNTLVVIADGMGCSNSKHLVKGSHSSWQRNKHVALVKHQLLAVAQVLTRQHLVVILRRTTRRLHNGRHHANRMTAGGLRRTCHTLH